MPEPTSATSTALTLATPAATPALPTMPPLSAALVSRLDSAPTEGLVGEIAADAFLVAELRDALPALREYATVPAGEAGVKRVIEARFVTYPQPQRSEAEWALFWRDYFGALKDLPMASLEAAMRAWVATPTSEFLPKPGQLLALAQATPSRALTRYARGRAALALADDAHRQRRRSLTQADREAVGVMLADYLKRAAQPPLARAARPRS